MIKIGNLICKKGEKIKGFWNIDDYKIPVTIIKGNEEGKVVAISAGVHNCEYTGIQTAIELSNEIEPENIKGTLIILQTVNYSGFFKKLPAILPEDNKNLNRVFPGDGEGSISDRIAFNFSNILYPKLDFFIDMHGGDAFEDVMSFIYAPGIGDLDIIEKAHNVAKIIDVPYRVRSKSSTGAYNSAAIQGVPSILIEKGGKGIWSKSDVIEYKNYIKNALRYLEVLDDKEELKINKNQQEIIEAKYIDSEFDAYWYPMFNPGDLIKKDDLLGELKDCFGKVIKEFRAEFDGVVLYQTVSLATYIGNSLIAYGKL